MHVTIQFIGRWAFVLKFVIAVVSMEIRNDIYPSIKLRRRYGWKITCVKLGKTHSKGFVLAVEEWDDAWFRKESVSKKGLWWKSPWIKNSLIRFVWTKQLYEISTVSHMAIWPVFLKAKFSVVKPLTSLNFSVVKSIIVLPSAGSDSWSFKELSIMSKRWGQSCLGRGMGKWSHEEHIF